MKRAIQFFPVVFLLIITASATEDYTKSPLTFSGFTASQHGQVVRGQYQWRQYNHVWTSNILGGLVAQFVASDYLTVRLGMEFNAWFNDYPLKMNAAKEPGNDKYWGIYLSEAFGRFSFLKHDAVSLKLDLGYFPYKYNPEVRCLGEYLFRSGTYPIYLINNFDFPLARLEGGRLGLSYTSEYFGVNLDLMALFEHEVRPFHDVTLASIFNFDIAKMFSLGGGVSFAHLISVDEELTTPTLKSVPDAAQSMYVQDNDTGFYTFRGTKLMARATIDLFGIAREKNALLGEILGGSGGKLYGELAIIGLKNYPSNSDVFGANPYGYDKLDEKTPVMFGFNIPFWKILDVFAIEFEHFKCPYPNHMLTVFRLGIPVPNAPGGQKPYDSTAYANKDNWKWSLYMKKRITNNFTCVLQMARNHERYTIDRGVWQNYDYQIKTVLPKEWLWHFKVQFDL